MPQITFAEWLPDQPALNNPGALEARGVIPMANGYRPFPASAPIGDALDARVRGAAYCRSFNAVDQIFAGTSNKLYRYIGGEFEDASVTGGYSTASEYWRYAQFGDQVFATNYNDDIQYMELSDGAGEDFSALSTSAPKARHLGVIGDFLFAGNTNDGDGSLPNRVRWSAFNDATDWPILGSTDAQEKQSDFQDLANGGAVMGIVGGISGTDGAIICETSIYRVQYSGPPFFFGFYEVENGKGCVAPNSLVNNGREAAYLAVDGFYTFNGQASTPIGAEKIDRWFYDTVDPTKLNEVWGQFDPINKLFVWAFASKNGNGLPDTLLIFHWELRKWAYARTSTETLFGCAIPGLTLEQLDTISASLDALPYSLDSRVWSGSGLNLAGFSTDHVLQFYNGQPMAAMIDTGELGLSGRRFYVKGFRPLVDGPNEVEVSGYLLSRSGMGGTPAVTGPRSPQRDLMCRFHKETRYARARITIDAGIAWTTALGVDFDIAESGTV